jgi:C4-dicarboxylate transporter, DctM subunit
MSTEQIVLIALVALLMLLMVRVPVAFSLAFSGALGLFLLRGLSTTEATITRLPVQTPLRFTLIIIPMFIAMGIFARHAGIGQETFDFIARRTRRLPGGVALATLLACGGFAAVSGSSVATVAALGRVSISEMRRHGYSTTFAAGVVGASGTLGVLIPPSIIIVLYGVITEQSIGALLVGGIIPGIISILSYAALIIYKSLRHPAIVGRESGSSHPATPAGGPGSASPELETRVAETTPRVDERSEVEATSKSGGGFSSVVRIGVLFVIVIGGVYTGLYTATEASAVGAFAALLMLIASLVRHPFVNALSRLKEAFTETVTITSMVFALMVGAGLFTFFLISAGVPRMFTSWVLSLPVPPLLVVALLLLAFIPLGMFLDSISALLIAVPMVFPVVASLGFDGIWFGILVVKMIEVGLITPPVGLNIYVVAGTAEDVSVSQAFRGIAMFLPMDLAVILLLFAFPTLVTFLPDAMG